MNLYYYNKKTIPIVDSVLCTLSGGQDSQISFFLFLHLQKYFKISLSLLYCHHFWQKTNFYCFWEIWQYTSIFKFPFYIVLSNKLFINEEQARNWRRKTFSRITNFFLIKKISIAHTGTDKIETALWNLFRGTSPTGISQFNNTAFYTSNQSHLTFISKKKLANKQKIFVKSNFFPIKFKNLSTIVRFYKVKSQKPTIFLLLENDELNFYDFSLKNHIDVTSIFNVSYLNFFYIKNSNTINIHQNHYLIYLYQTIYCINKQNVITVIRPLVDYQRQDITALLKQFNIPIFPDPTNESFQWTRNKIRLKIIPIFQQDFNQLSQYHIVEFLEILSNEQIFIKKIIWQCLEIFLLKKIVPLNIFPKAIQQLLLITVLKFYSERQINLSQIKQIIKIFQF